MQEAIREREYWDGKDFTEWSCRTTSGRHVDLAHDLVLISRYGFYLRESCSASYDKGLFYNSCH
jgi:hypothetical protein